MPASRPALARVGPGTGAAGVAEELSFDHGGSQRAAVDRDKGLGGVGAVGVDGARDQLLAGAGLAGDEDGMAGAGDLGEDAIELLHGGRVADEVAHGGSGAEAVAEDAGLHIERPALGGAIERGGELFEREGLGEVVAGADAHGFDRGGDAGEGRHDDDDGLGMAGANVFEQRQTSASGELEIEQQDIDGAVGQGEARGGDGVGGLGGEAEALGDLGAGVADRGVVVDDQHAERRNVVGIDAARDGGGGVILRPGDRCMLSGGKLRLAGWSLRRVDWRVDWSGGKGGSHVQAVGFLRDHEQVPSNRSQRGRREVEVAGGGGARGHLMQKTVPLPGRTWMESLPELAVTSSWTMRWPRPRMAPSGSGSGRR